MLVKVIFHAVKCKDIGSPQKETVLRIFIALNNPSSLAGFEPVNLGLNGKHNNH
jgi:hypothetical protein